MTRPTVRVLALLEILQAGGTRSAADLAARIEVDERTIRRYVEHLVDLGIAVRSVRGRYGGYRLEPGHRMPPMAFSDGEAVSVVLGLVVSQRAGFVGSTVALQSAVAKLRRVMPQALSRRVAALLDIITFTALAGSSVAPDAALMLLFAEAARDRRPIAFGYVAGDGRRTERRIEPYAIVAHQGRWHVTGTDGGSGEVRSFRLDRVRTARLLDGTFAAPDDFDATTHLLRSIARAPHAHAVSLRVRATAAEALQRFPRALVTAEELEGGWTRVRLGAERLDWVPGVVVATGLDFVVEDPPELRALIRELAARLITATT